MVLKCYSRIIAEVPGYNSGSQGSVAVTGAGSKWTNTNLYVGYQGTGTLTVSDGGLVQTRTLFASLADLSGNGRLQAKGVVMDTDLRFDGSHGLNQNIPFGTLGTLVLTVDGTGDLGAGYKGTASLTIADGRVVPAKVGYLGYWPGAQGTAVLMGSGSKWALSSNLYVGYEGKGVLSLYGETELSDTYGTVGYGANSEGKVEVNGGNWSNSSGLSVGYKGKGTLQIFFGGRVASPTGYVGHYAGSQGTVVLDGSASTWTNTGILYIGRAGNGAVTVHNGAQLSNAAAYLGYYSGVSGSVTVTGTASLWTSSSTLYGGYQGTANISIQQGGRVEDPFGLLGYLAGSQGNATVAGSGSTWNHSVGLAVGYYGKGNLLVQQGGQVSTIAGYIGYYAGSEGTATLTGSGSKWTNTGTLFFVGRAGTGTLAIQQGAHLEHSGKAYLGFYSGSTGKVTVAGAGSLWNNTDAIYVGHVASGRVEIRDGGQVASSSAILGYASTGQGALVVSGSGSAWTVGGSGYVLAGYDGVGIIKIRSGGQISSPTGFLGYGSRSQATALVAGANSKWLNSSTLYVGKSGVASLDLRTGGQVTAQTVSINSRSTLSVDVGHGSLLTVGGGSGTLTNNGTVRIIAGAAAPAGSQYSPIAAGAWTGSGQYQAVGGTWNPSTRQFTASAVQSGASGSPIQMDLAQVQRLLVSDSATGWQVGASFLASSGPKSLTVTATAISGSVRTALESQLAAGESLLGGWLFTTTGSFALSDPAYLSFRVGSGWTEERLQVWQYQQASGWTRMEPGDLNYVNLYTNFLTTLGTLNGYGYAVSGLSAAGLAAMEAPPGEGKAEQPLSDPQSPSEPSPKPGSLERAPDLARELHLTDPLSILPEFSGLAQEVIEAVEEPSDLLVNIPAHYRNFHLMESPRPSDALQGAPEPSSLLLLLLASMGIGTYMLLRGRK